MAHHPTHLEATFSTVHGVTPVVTIDGQTYGGTPYTLNVMKRDYYGYVIVTETDARGADHGERIYVEGIKGDFNTDEDAADYVDELLGEASEDGAADWLAYREEHSLRSWQRV